MRFAGWATGPGESRRTVEPGAGPSSSDPQTRHSGQRPCHFAVSWPQALHRKAGRRGRAGVRPPFDLMIRTVGQGSDTAPRARADRAGLPGWKPAYRD